MLISLALALIVGHAQVIDGDSLRVAGDEVRGDIVACPMLKRRAPPVSIERDTRV